MEPQELKTLMETAEAAILASVSTKIDAAKSEWKKHFDEQIAKGAPADEVRLQVDRAIKRLDAIEADFSRPERRNFGKQKSIGEFLTENAALAELREKTSTGYTTGTRAKIPVDSFMRFDEFEPIGQKTTITSAAVGSSTPGILMPQRLPGIVKPGVRRIRVRDLMPRSTTIQNAIEFLKEDAYTNNASMVAETISKPESALTFTIDSSPVRTLAHWIPAAKQILADFAALGAYINVRLLEGLKDIEDWELVAGDGTGQHLSGLTSEATAYDTARNVTGDSKIDKINHAISQIEDVLQEADGIIMNPRDWRAIQLIKTNEGSVDNNGAYLLGGPAGNATPTLWGLPVATTTAVAVGKFFVGAFRQYCEVHDRMQAVVDISTEHADYFVRNMVAIRAEERIAFTVKRADAVVYGTY